jgi:hypothetical protein
MTRMAFNKKILFLLAFIIVWSLNSSAVAATQIITGGTTAALGVSGDNVSLIAQPPNAVLNVPAGFDLGSTNGLSTGDSVTSNPTPNNGLVNFSGNSTVTGMMGVTGQVLNDITGGAAGTTVTFNGAVSTRAIDFTAASTMIFNANSSGALHYNTFDGTAILGSGVTFAGAATSTAANSGVLTLNNASQYIGAVGDATFFINQINLNANAGITGAIASQNIVLGANTLTQTGAVTFPVNAQITVRALSDAAYGRINAPGSAINFTNGLTVNMLVDDPVILSGVPLQVVTGTSGTFGPGSAPITVTSNNPRFTFTGLNPAGTGNVIIFPTIVPVTGVVSTNASPSVPLGGSISDTATLSGAFIPTGTITFRLFGPNDATCFNAAIFTSTVTVSGNGSYGSTPAFTPTAAGAYRWIADYSGDTNNSATANACNGANESVLVVAPIPTVRDAALLLLAMLLGMSGLLAVSRASKKRNGMLS